MASDGTVKLSDFGLGALAEARAADGMLRTVCGTPNYAAPEVLASEPYRGGSADLWSLGGPHSPAAATVWGVDEGCFCYATGCCY